jgi:carboxylate-amine ligase
MILIPPFKKSDPLSIGIELELQLVDLYHYNLVMESKDFLRRLSEILPVGTIKPEITQSMIEINSPVHSSYEALLTDVRGLRNTLVAEADRTHIGISGGGAHPFQKWKEQRIFETERFANFSEQYGYLAKQFTVFGQHIHIGCENADDALYLCHAFARYIPQFISLSAASPFYQDVDTSFDCSRLAVISAFPLSGTPPWILSWDQFEDYYQKMADLGIIKSMKDFYWDIRPKPEFGTIELRICDTPLTIEKAVMFAAYAQALAFWLLDERPTLSQDIYLTYFVNRFRAARYGLDAILIDPINKTTVPIADDIINTCKKLAPYADQLDSSDALKQVSKMAEEHKNDAAWLRERYTELKSYNDVVRCQSELWREHA